LSGLFQVLQIITNVAKASEELRDEVIHAGIVDYVTGQCLGPASSFEAAKLQTFIQFPTHLTMMRGH